ncbi:MAG: beta-lactamase family protein [Phycisphaerales bacterium]|nr:MAG: beta-lactamase family protein [Phycisphaerales bacterium]
MREQDLVMGKNHTIIHRKNLRQSILTGVLGLLGLVGILNCVGCQAFRKIPKTGQQRREGIKPELATLVDKFRTSTPKSMKKHKIPGCALALVDDKGVLWTEGFGTTDFKRKIPVTPDTLFYIGSISKTFTAVAVLIAVQDGLLDLDEPITTYLPDFKVYSRYEERPASKITLRHLLSHTSGLPREAPGCNMVEFEGNTLEDRYRSIEGLWLQYPTGRACLYSNAGFDLAAYVLQAVSGIPFEQYMKKHVFRPLGMHNSTLDRDKIKSDTNRAVGHTIGIVPSPTPPDHGLLGSGGVWTDARDLARFIQYFLNTQSPEGKQTLSESWLEVMLTPHARISSEEEVYCGLGIGINRTSGWTEMRHGGGGLGQTSWMYWCPKYGIGGLVLTNKMPLSDIRDMAIGQKLLRQGRLRERFVESESDYNRCIAPWTTWSGHTPSQYKSEWKKYCGKYDLKFGGFKLKWWAKLVLSLDSDPFMPRIKVSEKDGYLCLRESWLFEAFSAVNDRQVNARLMEAQSGVFYTASGDVLNFKGRDPTWRSYRFKKR